MSTTADQGSQPRARAAELSPELRALGLAFRHLFRAVSRMRGRDTHLAAGELSYAQFELLIELDERGELSVGELALAARIAPASVTQLLDGLLDLGYVTRERSDVDRRVVRAALTELGRARVETKRAAWQERWERALSDVAPRELKVATRVLERLAEVFNQDLSAEGCAGVETPAATGRKPA